MNIINKDELIKTDLVTRLTVDGITDTYDVYKIKLDKLYYNDQNDRIATWISRYKADNHLESFDLSNIEEYNKIIANFIKESDEKAFKKTRNNIKALGQTEPAVILRDGRIIDGNRRFTCLRDLAKEDLKFNYLDAIIISKDIQNSKKEIKLLELYLQHGREERVGYNPIDRLVGVYNDVIKNQLITIDEYAKNTEQTTSEVKKMVDRASLMVEFLEFIDMPEHYYLARDWDLDGPLGEIRAVLNKVKTEEQREDLKNIIFTNIAAKPNTDMTRYIRKIKNLVNTPQFRPFIEENMKLCERFLEKFDGEEEKTVEFINNEVRGDEQLIDDLKNTYDKYQEKVKKRNSINAPKNQIEKAIDALQNIDFDIVLRLNDETDYPQFLNSLEMLEEEIKNIKNEVYGNVSSSNES
ncbi:ParB/RepB/Spo0J family partition protein [Staphylococcus aureus]|uniref:ParB/RepB/Spo0J family partition protein n=1 Tax=Staphylococcus aureus TaxID=1280 RepID=UPI00202DD22C|nr:ParB/RepB/Spo0J family partition protein [Staphylococcus aureus]MCM0450744.1 ParB/RepB/Spo0J family partition protein [Staphylococcus aureus]MCM0455934.1 ParB/RepB/Spo0J family partition protein [Staphylococcus aureus]MCM0461069.1 ParB/RepB/Spo0J family partition protein [Staphylococcus aureus]MCM0462446.1 ParB/RepB/Spo0J family partition protein [Staphylococcus aureus]MCM0468913.1 ParB/RepB/Spo0J family partition protein [Staphylococcus aureus]